MKILLVNPLVREWSLPNCFPLGLGYISAVLQKAEHEVDVLDLNALRVSRNHISEYKEYDLIGLTGIITQYGEVKRLSKAYKKLYPRTPIICGGALATSVPNLLSEKTDVDICILGEGEKVIFDLLDDISIRCFWAKYSSDFELIEDISTIGWPAYDSFPIETYIKNPIAADNVNKWKDGGLVTPPRRSMNMIGSRGCPYNCIYCYHCYMGQDWRVRSTNDILGEMGFLKGKYQVEYIHFVDDAFACSKKKMMEFCRGKIYSYVSDVQWSCAGRANIIDEEMIEIMAAAGCIGICYGLESGSQKMLDVMNKKITVKQYEKAIALNRKYFSYEDYTFMTNMLGETPKDVQMTIDFCKRNEIVPSAVFFTQAYPGTELFSVSVKQKKIFTDKLNWMEKYVLSLGEQGEKLTINFTDYPNEEVMEWHRRIIEETGAGNKQKH